MGYAASDKILPAEYNAFLTNTSNSGDIAAYGINHIMGTGLLNLGLGQTALHTVNTAEKITVAQWNSLWTAMNNIQNHTNITALTSTASREVGDVIAVKAALLTDLNALATAVQGGSTSATAIALVPKIRPAKDGSVCAAGTVTTGASFTAVTVIVAVAVLPEKAVLLAFVLTSAVAPAVPLVWSHARYVIVAVPL